MENLGVGRVLCPTQGRFYRPHMKQYIEHYVTRVCDCLKLTETSASTWS